MSKMKIGLTAGILGAVSLLAVAAASAGHGHGGKGWRGDVHGYGHGKGYHRGHGGKGGYGHHGGHKRGGHRHGGMLQELQRMDANSDTKVTREEFLAVVDTRFSKYDADGSGTLSAEETVLDIGPRAEYRLKRMMKRYDTDGNGTISKDEFTAKARERFASRDFDGDGKISDDEMPPRWKKGRGRDEDNEARGDDVDEATLTDEAEAGQAGGADTAGAEAEASVEDQANAEAGTDTAAATEGKEDVDEARGDGRRERMGRHGKGHHGKGRHGKRGYGKRHHGRYGKGHRGKRCGGHHGKGRWGHGSARTVEEAVEQSAKYFDRLDRNNDGVLGAVDILSHGGKNLDYAARVKMHRLDADKNGEVTQEEFRAAAEQRFDRFDLDSNGEITPEDLPPRAASHWARKAARDE